MPTSSGPAPIGLRPSPLRSRSYHPAPLPSRLPARSNATAGTRISPWSSAGTRCAVGREAKAAPGGSEAGGRLPGSQLRRCAGMPRQGEAVCRSQGAPGRLDCVIVGSSEAHIRFASHRPVHRHRPLSCRCDDVRGRLEQFNDCGRPGFHVGAGQAPALCQQAASQCIPAFVRSAGGPAMVGG